MITNPTLPPKEGYVEVEVGGRRTYRNVKTGILIDYETSTVTPTSEPDTAIWDELAEAYKQGVQSAYDE